VDPGRELNGRSQQSHLFGDVDVAGPVGPSSRASAFWAISSPFRRSRRACRREPRQL